MKSFYYSLCGHTADENCVFLCNFYVMSEDNTCDEHNNLELPMQAVIVTIMSLKRKKTPKIFYYLNTIELLFKKNQKTILYLYDPTKKRCSTHTHFNVISILQSLT